MLIPTKKSTAENLQDIDDEVNGLHPILNKLFNSLPSIEHVHYTHGPNEMGADFVLFRKDEALNRTTCVGVVAKASTIKQDTADVDRQISECFIDRHDANSNLISIREVWVVTSSNITQNAKIKLSKNYSEQKIEFITRDDLARLIDTYAPDAFTTTPPKFQSYADILVSQINADDSRSLVVAGLEPFYIEPLIVRLSLNSYGKSVRDKKVPSLERLIEEIATPQVSFIEAGPGGGKSKIGREIARKVLNSETFISGDLVPRIVHTKEIISDVKDIVDINCTEIRDAVGKNSRILFIIDGFDEVEITDARRAEIVEELCLYSASGANVTFLILTRPFDKASVLLGRINSIRIYKIEPLTGSRAIKFLKQVGGHLAVGNRVVEDLQKSALMRALDGAPIAYMLLGRLLAENQAELPSNLTELFQKYTELVLGRWEIAKGLRSQQEYEVLVEALIWLSTYMLDNEITEVAVVEFQSWVDEYCAKRRIRISSDDLIRKVSHRGSTLYLRSDVQVFGFRHRAFCEFFYAMGLSRKKLINLDASVFSMYWLNSYFFLAGIKKDCPELLDSLLSIELADEASKLLRIINFGNFLLAAYLTPLEVADKAVRHIACELSALYSYACDPRSKTPLGSLPTIQLLCFFSTLFRQQYGYRYFKDALEGAIFELERGDNSECKALALFLLTTAYQASGGDLRFDELIEGYGADLPTVVKLAITHESDRMKEISDRVKKMERNLRKAFQNSDDFINRLYNVPIKKLDKKLLG